MVIKIKIIVDKLKYCIVRYLLQTSNGHVFTRANAEKEVST